MIDEDKGVSRFFSDVITLTPLDEDDATQLVHDIIHAILADATKRGSNIRAGEDIEEKIVRLSGGHPHLLQLLGAELIHNHNQDPDDSLDAHDLIGSLGRICYQIRGKTYESILHQLEVEGRLEQLRDLLTAARGKVPTRIAKDKAVDIVDADVLVWLVSHEILYIVDSVYYGLTDEFLRVRLILDQDRSEAEDLERRLLEAESYEEDEDPYR